MPVKWKSNPGKTQQEQIADLKETCFQFFREFPVQKAGADFIGRSVDTVQAWQRDDSEFSAMVSRAKAEWAKKASRRVRPDKLLANRYDETKPPKQEIDTKVTTIEGQSAEDLLEEAKRLGLNTSQYEPLLTGNRSPGTDQIKKERDRRLVEQRALDDFPYFVAHLFAASFKHFVGGTSIDLVARFLASNKLTARVGARDHFKSTSLYAGSCGTYFECAMRTSKATTSPMARTCLPTTLRRSRT
jgi:hypothetical protein